MTNYTLSQIKAHPNFPFDDFETNSLSFLMLELYWSQLFSELIGESKKGWQPSLKAELDGNPIFCATSLILKRQLTVIHKTNKDNKPAYPTTTGEGTYYGLQAWLNNGISIDGTTSLNELVLFADLNSITETEALKLIRLHCIELKDESTVEAAIAEYEELVKMPE
jgi:hypothetical protein